MMILLLRQSKPGFLRCFYIFVMPSGDLEAFKKQSFVLKEGVEYRIKINFKVSF